MTHPPVEVTKERRYHPLVTGPVQTSTVVLRPTRPLSVLRVLQVILPRGPETEGVHDVYLSFVPHVGRRHESYPKSRLPFAPTVVETPTSPIKWSEKGGGTVVSPPPRVWGRLLLVRGLPRRREVRGFTLLVVKAVAREGSRPGVVRP